jgi:hypothetical protein
MSGKEWMSEGACASGDHDPSLWFPEKGEAARAGIAKKICNTECPVRDTCREYAVTFPVILLGVWGGLSKGELQAARLSRGIQTVDERTFSSLPADARLVLRPRFRYLSRIRSRDP